MSLDDLDEYRPAPMTLTLRPMKFLVKLLAIRKILSVDMISMTRSQNFKLMYVQMSGLITVPDANCGYPAATDTIVMTQQEYSQRATLASMSLAVTTYM